jgi:hypothetical protein
LGKVHRTKWEIASILLIIHKYLILKTLRTMVNRCLFRILNFIVKLSKKKTKRMNNTNIMLLEDSTLNVNLNSSNPSIEEES